MLRDPVIVMVIAAIILSLTVPGIACAGTLRLAVAANFKTTLTNLVNHYPAEDSEQIEIIPGSTGALTAQLIQGAPFHILFAADRARPEELERRALVRHRQTYAIGQLAFWVRGKSADLKSYEGSIAIANPRHAPYGLAATEVLARLNPNARVIFGNNVAQAFTFVQTGNAPAGLVSLSQVIEQKIPTETYWRVPGRYHSPIEQQLVIMNNAPESATRFISWLNTSDAKRLISDAGYGFER